MVTKSLRNPSPRAFATGSFALALVAALGISTPAIASDLVPVDYCANLTTQAVTSITEGACPAGELSLGATAIARGEKRPKALVPQFKNRYTAARAAAKKKGYTLQITSGWRSYKYQKQLHQKAIKRHGSVAEASKWVLPPEKSNHPWGIAVDINYKVGGKKAKKAAAWLEANGYKFGLCRRYENEWWHFEPLVAPGQPCPAMEPYAS